MREQPAAEQETSAEDDPTADDAPSPLQLEMASDVIKRVHKELAVIIYADTDALLDSVRVQAGDPSLELPAAGNVGTWKHLHGLALSYGKNLA